MAQDLRRERPHRCAHQVCLSPASLARWRSANAVTCPGSTASQARAARTCRSCTRRASCSTRPSTASRRRLRYVYPFAGSGQPAAHVSPPAARGATTRAHPPRLPRPRLARSREGPLHRDRLGRAARHPARARVHRRALLRLDGSQPLARRRVRQLGECVCRRAHEGARDGRRCREGGRGAEEIRAQRV